MGTDMATVTITEEPLQIEELLAVVDGARVQIDDAVRARIATARSVVADALAAGEAVYGLTTGVGHSRNTRLTAAEIDREQRLLVLSHGGGIGAPLPVRVVRAAMMVRLNGIARGGSGAGVAVAEVLAAMLNAYVHPLVPETASVGAGDLGHMAGIAQVAIGEGRAEYQGQSIPGGEALRRAGVTPLVLGGRDGLALVAANGVSVGDGALAVAAATRVAESADVAAALSMEAIAANPSVLHQAVARAKPVAGQEAAAEHLRKLLAGSVVLEPGGALSVQDPLSFRVVPQVHGALREYTAAARCAVLAELNAATDNPLVALPERCVLSNGNFQPIGLAVAFDALRVALAHVGLLSDRRMSHLWEALFRTPERELFEKFGEELPAAAYGVQLRFPAAALLAELKQLAAPASLDVPPLELGIEDHATAAPLVVRKSHAAIELLADVLAVELLLAHDVLVMSSATPRLGIGTRAAFNLAERVIADADPRPEAVHRALRRSFPTPEPQPRRRD